MPVTWKDIAFEPGPTFGDGVMQSWEWMTDRKDLKPFLCSKIGDVFCTDALGAVHWLDCSSGKLQWITPNRAIFDSECEKNGAKMELWFGSKLIEKLHEAGQIADAGEAYMFLTLPNSSNCEFEPHNVKIMPANEVFVGLADIQKLYTDIPDDERVRHKIVD